MANARDLLDNQNSVSTESVCNNNHSNVECQLPDNSDNHREPDDSSDTARQNSAETILAATKDVAETPDVLEATSNNIVKLPVLKLSIFDGKTEQFPSFYEGFKSLVHKNKRLDDMSRFLYLKSCLDKEATKVIEHLEVVSSNYQVALSLLEKRYKNKQVLVHNHIKGIVEFPKIPKESAVDLRDLSDTLQALLRALDSLGEPTKTWSSILLYIIVNKFDYHSKKEWEIETSHLDSIDNSTLTVS